jgi:hypothetical protein
MTKIGRRGSRGLKKDRKKQRRQEGGESVNLSIEFPDQKKK